MIYLLYFYKLLKSFKYYSRVSLQQFHNLKWKEIIHSNKMPCLFTKILFIKYRLKYLHLNYDK